MILLTSPSPLPGIIIFLILILVFLIWKWATEKTFRDIIQETQKENYEHDRAFLGKNPDHKLSELIYNPNQPSPLKIPEDLFPPDKILKDEKYDTEAIFPREWIFQYYAKYKTRMMGTEQPFMGIRDFWLKVKKRKERLMSISV